MNVARTLVLALALAGCAKASDLAAKQQETVAYAKSYDARLYEMFQRGVDFLERLNRQNNAPGVQDAHNTLARNNAIYKSMKTLVDTVPGQIEAAIKAGKPDDLRKVATSLAVNVGAPNPQTPPATDMMVELQRVMDSLNARLQDGYIEGNAHLDTVEAYLVRVENALSRQEPEPVAHPPPPPPSDKDSDPEPDKDEKAPEPGAGSGSGSAAAPPAAGSGAAAPRPAAGSGSGSAAPR